eukprot:Opistho-1_new@93151
MGKAPWSQQVRKFRTHQPILRPGVSDYRLFSATAMPPSPQRPVLVVRLSNWIGDVVLMLPSLLRLSEAYTLHLVGKGWMPGLLAGYGWPCHVYPKKLGQRAHVLCVD